MLTDTTCMEPKSINIVSNRGKIYTVSGLDYVLSDPYCDCPGFQYRGSCKHIELALEKLKENNEFNPKP